MSKQKARWACGHVTEINTRQKCADCQRRDKEKRKRKKVEERKAQIAKRLSAHTKPVHEGRLPDGATFQCGPYDAASERWTVTLTIGETVLKTKGPAVELAMRELAQQWREMKSLTI